MSKEETLDSVEEVRIIKEALKLKDIFVNCDHDYTLWTYRQ